LSWGTLAVKQSTHPTKSGKKAKKKDLIGTRNRFMEMKRKMDKKLRK
jgi:hypothetical protein